MSRTDYRRMVDVDQEHYAALEVTDPDDARPVRLRTSGPLLELTVDEARYLFDAIAGAVATIETGHALRAVQTRRGGMP